MKETTQGGRKKAGDVILTGFMGDSILVLRYSSLPLGTEAGSPPQFA